MNLNQLKEECDATVLSVDGNTVMTKRMMEMGITPGVPIRVIKSAPFGDPIEVRVRGYNLAMRRAEAESVKILTDNA
jgi:ferrous iron transport protein A